MAFVVVCSTLSLRAVVLFLDSKMENENNILFDALFPAQFIFPSSKSTLQI